MGVLLSLFELSIPSRTVVDGLARRKTTLDQLLGKRGQCTLEALVWP